VAALTASTLAYSGQHETFNPSVVSHSAFKGKNGDLKVFVMNDLHIKPDYSDKDGK
jgi:hypothetical protein